MLMCIQNVVRSQDIEWTPNIHGITERRNISRVHKILFAFVYFYVCPRPLTRQSILSESVVFTFIKQTKVAFCVDEVGARQEKTLH